jgi:hypothetical protein
MPPITRLFLTVLTSAVLALTASGAPRGARLAGPNDLPSGASLFVAPMEWNLDASIRSELGKNKLPLRLVGRAEDADFIMTGSSVKLGSRLVSPGRDFQVTIVAAHSGTPVWTGGAGDYAVFFGRLRSHGPARAARSIVFKLRNRFFPASR